MKRLLISLSVLLLAGAVQGAQKKQAAQPGTPAILEAVTGKKARVFLQRTEEGKLVFQPYKSTREIAVDASKIKSLTFPLKYDEEGIRQQFTEGDYAGVIATLEPLLEPYVPYMIVPNNLRDPFIMLMKAYRETGAFAKARNFADTLLRTGDPGLALRARVIQALAAVAEGDLAAAEKIQASVTNEAAALYLEASIKRAKKEYKPAILTAVKIITDHGNDMDWLPPAELLCARLYLDMGMTNSAAHTARQVEHIYAGTHISADARRLREEIGPLEEEQAEAQPEENAQTNTVETTTGTNTVETAAQTNTVETATAETNETATAGAPEPGGME